MLQVRPCILLLQTSPFETAVHYLYSKTITPPSQTSFRITLYFSIHHVRSSETPRHKELLNTSNEGCRVTKGISLINHFSRPSDQIFVMLHSTATVAITFRQGIGSAIIWWATRNLTSGCKTVSDGSLKLKRSDYGDHDQFWSCWCNANQLTGTSNLPSVTNAVSSEPRSWAPPPEIVRSMHPLDKMVLKVTHERETMRFVQCRRAFLNPSMASRDSCFPAQASLQEKVLITKPNHQLSYSILLIHSSHSFIYNHFPSSVNFLSLNYTTLIITG